MILLVVGDDLTTLILIMDAESAEARNDRKWSEPSMGSLDNS